MLKKVETLTQAEEALLAAASSLGDGDAQRAAAAGTLRERGLPTRRVEAWHYTDLRNRMKGFAGLAEKPDTMKARAWLDSHGRLIPAARLPFLDGAFLLDHADAIPAGVSVTHGAGAAGYRDGTDAIALMNTLLSTDGARIEIAPGMAVEKPIGLVHGVTGEGASVLRHAVSVHDKASAMFIERHSSANGLAVHSNTVTGLTLGAGAQVIWVIVQEEGDAATHLAQLNVTLGADANLTVLVLNAGGALVRREIRVAVRGSNSQLSIRGVNLIGGDSHLDVTTSLVHEVPDTVSNEIFRNVATQSGKGVFQGEIRVAQAAQKTDARMACNTLLLSDEAEFSAKPELEIFADDVQCAHGATVTDIEDDHLFYLRARGIGEKEARSLLVKAFVEEVFDDLEHEVLHDALNARIEDWLDRNG